MPSGTGWQRTSNQRETPSANANSSSSCTGTRRAIDRESTSKTRVASMPGQHSGIVRPSSSAFGRRFCTAAASLR